MKRRRFLQTIGAGGIVTGGLASTSSFTEVRSQRRVKIEVDEKDEEDPTAISFISFCPEIADPGAVVIAITDTDEDGDPVEIEYEVPPGYEGELILKGGSEWYRFPIPPNPGTARMGDGELLCDDAPSSCQPPGEDYVRCPRSPCLNQRGTKFEADDDFESVETTQPLCPGESSGH